LFERHALQCETAEFEFHLSDGKLRRCSHMSDPLHLGRVNYDRPAA